MQVTNTDPFLKLINEVFGLAPFEAEIREIIGNTNWNVLTQRTREARAALSKAEPVGVGEPDVDLVMRCKEVMAWQDTGFLPGEALRDLSQEIRDENGLSDDGEALRRAENATAREAMEFVVSTVRKENGETVTPSQDVEPASPAWWQDEAAAEREFTEYFCRNYPGPDTVISKPEWHAPKLFRAAKQALLATVVSRPPAPETAVLEKLPAAFEVLDTENGETVTPSQHAELIAQLQKLTSNTGRDHRTGEEFVHGVGSQEVVDALRSALAALQGIPPSPHVELPTVEQLADLIDDAAPGILRPDTRLRIASHLLAALASSEERG